MKTFSITFIICGLFFFSIIGCGENTFHNSSQNLTIDSLCFGTDSTLEVMTWNLQDFPKKDEITIDYVVQIIQALDIDIIALQEIGSSYYFNQLKNSLSDWNGVVTNNSYLNLGYLYNPNNVTFSIKYEILTNEYWALPRSPFVLEIDYQNRTFVIINNHLKAYGDSVSVERRRQACILLEGYIKNNHSDKNVILLGDLNDSLTDNETSNVFQIFLNEPENYLFVDMEIADGSSSNWSYPWWPSHIDHILITDELFDEFLNISSDVQTIKVDKYLDGSFDEYYVNISDHRPVALKLYFHQKKGKE